VCVGESYVDEPLVGTVILPQIGELPVHLSLGEVLLYRIVYPGRVCYRSLGDSVMRFAEVKSDS